MASYFLARDVDDDFGRPRGLSIRDTVNPNPPSDLGDLLCVHSNTDHSQLGISDLL